MLKRGKLNLRFSRFAQTMTENRGKENGRVFREPERGGEWLAGVGEGSSSRAGTEVVE